MNLTALIQTKKIEIKNGSFIYFLVDNEEIVYIGQTIKPYPSISNHREKIFTHVSIIPFDEFKFTGTPEELMIELIIKYLPKYNTVLPPNERYMTKGIIKKNFDVNGFEINKLIKKMV